MVAVCIAMVEGWVLYVMEASSSLGIATHVAISICTCSGTMMSILSSAGVMSWEENPNTQANGSWGGGGVNLDSCGRLDVKVILNIREQDSKRGLLRLERMLVMSVRSSSCWAPYIVNCGRGHRQ